MTVRASRSGKPSPCRCVPGRLGVLALLFCGAAADLFGEYPRLCRSLWWKAYEYDAGTCALFHLDEKGKVEKTVDFDAKPEDRGSDDLLMGAGDVGPEDAAEPVKGKPGGKTTKNAVPGSPDAELVGDCALVEKGYLGGGLRLSGGKGMLYCKGLHAKNGVRGVEFWLKVEEYPKTEAVLVYHAAPPKRQPGAYQAKEWNENLTPLLLLVKPDGALELAWHDKRQALTPPKIPPKQWAHISFCVTNIWPYGSSVFLFLNGRRAFRSVFDPDHAHRIAYYSESCLIGNSPGGDKGLNGIVDEVRVSNSFRDYYEYDLDWPQPSRKPETGNGQPYFRDEKDLLFHLDFDGTLKPVRCAEGTDYPGYQLADNDAELNPAKVAATFPPGVEGRGLMLGRGGLRPVFSARGNILPARGTIAFWMQPVDWDNFSRDNPYDNINPTSFGLFQLDSTTVKGSHAALFGGRTRMLQFTIPMHLPESVDDPVNFAPGRWVHLAMTWEGATFSTYVDGRSRDPEGAFTMHVETRTEGDPYPYHKASARWWVESKPIQLLFQENQYWEQSGLPVPQTVMDDFRIYRRPLAPTEIANLAKLHDPRQELVKLPPADMDLHANGVLGKVKTALIPLISQYEQVAGASLKVTKVGEKEAFGKATASFGEQRQGSVLVETRPMEFATYEVLAELLDANGQALASVKDSFTRKPPPWWGCQAGVSDKPMPEWDPVRIEGNRISVSVRDIQLAPSGLPEKVVSAGEDVLARPISLAISAAGKEIPLKSDREAVEVVKRTEERVDFRGGMSGPELAVNTDAYAEFDGMMWFAVTLTPLGQPVSVDSAVLTIPYRLESAELMHWWSGERDFRDHQPPQAVYIGSLPEGEGAVFRSNDKERVRQLENLRGSFIPYLMLTGMKRGMAWFAESDRGWTQSMEVPAVSVVRDGKTVSLVLNVISSKVTVDCPRSFSFGLHPIPVRRLDPDWRRFPGGISSCMPDTFSGNNLKGRKGPTAFNIYPEDDWDAVRRRIDGEGLTKGAAGLKALYEAQIERFRKAGHEPLPIELNVPGLYWDLQWSGRHPEHTREWAEAWGLGYGDLQFYTPEFIDYTAWAWNDWLKRTDKFIQGAYMDDCWGVPQSQLGGPVAYQLPDGHVQPGFQFRGYRERLKRMRQISWDNGVVPHLTAHTTHTFLIPYHSFFDTILDGEDRYSDPPDQTDFLDHWRLDRMRFNHNEKWGLVTIWLGWAGNSLRPEKWPAWSFRQTRAYIAHLAQHEIAWGFDEKVIQDFGLRERDTVFIPYWDRGGTAKSSDPNVKVTVWKRPGKCLVLLFNTGNERSEVEVEFDLKRLGLADAKVEARDADPTLLSYFKEDSTTQETPDVPDGKKLEETAALDEDEAPEEELEQTPDKLPLEERRAKDPDGKFEWTGGVLKCPVRRHDYRLFLFRSASEQAKQD